MSELRAILDLPLGEKAPREARKAVRHMLAAWGYTRPDWLSSAELVVSELVSNAVRHGGGFIELSLQAHEGQITILAADGSTVVPRRHDTRGVGGHGISVIEANSVQWGAEAFEGGKRVWVRLRNHPASPGEEG